VFADERVRWLHVRMFDCMQELPGDYLVAGPRASPALLAAVWTLTYHLPASNSSAWASVSVAEPSNEPLSAPAIGTTTPPFFPGSPEWKCAAVAGPLRPDTVPFQDNFLLAVS